MEKIEPFKLPNGLSGENFQLVILFIDYLKVKLIVWSSIDIFLHCRLEVIPKGSAAGDSLIEKADDSG